MGVPRVWVSDTATHFKNRVIAQLSDALKVDHRFAVTYTPWSNGTCERMVREVVRALKSTLSEQRKQVGWCFASRSVGFEQFASSCTLVFVGKV